MLVRTCKAEYASATDEDHTHYWLRLAAEGDPHNILRQCLLNKPCRANNAAKHYVLAFQAGHQSLCTWMDEFLDMYGIAKAVSNIAYELGLHGDCVLWHSYCTIKSLARDEIPHRLFEGICDGGHLSWFEQAIEGLSARFIATSIAKFDRLKLLQRWYELGGNQWPNGIDDVFVQENARQCLAYFHKHGGWFSEECVRMAVINEDVDLLKYLIKRGAPWNLQGNYRGRRDGSCMTLLRELDRQQNSR
jgi:hypothetical protein